MKSMLTAGLALASCVAFAERSWDFGSDAAADLTGVADCYGEGSLVTGEGSPAEGAVLALDGLVVCSNNTAAANKEWGNTKFLLKVPTEGVDDFAAEGLEGCQFAVALGALEGDALKVMAYYLDPASVSTTPSNIWQGAGFSVATGTWVQVEMDFDYKDNKVSLAMGGATNLYPMAVGYTPAGPGVSKMLALSFVGASKVDTIGIVETNAVPAAALPEALQGFTALDLAELDVSIDDLHSTATGANSGLTVAEKITAGLNLAAEQDKPFASTKLAEGSSVNELAITIPCDTNNGQAYEVVINGTTVVNPTSVSEPSDGKRTLTFAVPSGVKVVKVQVRAKAPSAN